VAKHTPADPVASVVMQEAYLRYRQLYPALRPLFPG
jgi:hypothetical protein